MGNNQSYFSYFTPERYWVILFLWDAAGNKNIRVTESVEMDNIYQAVKGFVRSIINLFVAVIELFAGIIDGMAVILGKLRPRASRRLDEIVQSKEGLAKHGIFGNNRLREAPGNDEELVKEIRSELQEKVTSRECYYYFFAEAETNGGGFYAVALSAFALILILSAMLFRLRLSIEVWGLAAAVMTAACAVVCILAARHQKKMKRNRIAKLILENEFRDIEWGKIHPIREVVRDEDNVEKKG